jgi:hypothetical protein
MRTTPVSNALALLAATMLAGAFAGAGCMDLDGYQSTRAAGGAAGGTADAAGDQGGAAGTADASGEQGGAAGMADAAGDQGGAGGVPDGGVGGAGGSPDAGGGAGGSPDAGVCGPGGAAGSPPADAGATILNLATWKASCESAGPGTVTGTGAWFSGADTWGGTSSQIVPCKAMRCGPCPVTSPFACSDAGRAGGYSAHLVGNKKDGDLYLGVSFGGNPVGSTGVSFWYKSTGAGNGGKVTFGLGMVQNANPNGGWPSLGGTCDPHEWGSTNVDQCLNLPTKEIPAAADWTQIRVKWTDLVWTPYPDTTEPAWWATGKTSIAAKALWFEVGLFYTANGDPRGEVDLWLDDVAFFTD